MRDDILDHIRQDEAVDVVEPRYNLVEAEDNLDPVASWGRACEQLICKTGV